MGYSCTQAAMKSFEATMIVLKNPSFKVSTEETQSSNSWKINDKEYFAEIGQENEDGAVTGSIWSIDGQYSTPKGRFRFSPEGICERGDKGIMKAWNVLMSNKEKSLSKTGG